jgi:tripartite-type tricarboxylate transporter receptor subunit TctC
MQRMLPGRGIPRNSFRPVIILAPSLLCAVLLAACAPARTPSATSPPPTTAAVAASAPGGEAQPTALSDEKAVADFYRGKHLKIVVGYAAGGGYDLYARTLARKIGSYIPGQPNVVVENMPGAGGLLAANYIARRAPRDGTEMATFIQSLVLSARVGQSGVELDPRTINWIGNPASEYTACAFRTDLGFTNFQQAAESGKTLQFGAASIGGENWYVPKLLEAGGIGKWNVVTGYDGTSKVRLAIEQGELDGGCLTALLQITPDWFQGNPPFGRILVQTGKSRQPDLPDVPTWRETNVDPALLPALEVAEAMERMARPFAMPAGVPADRLAAVRRAWVQAWQDPEIVEVARTARLPINAQDSKTLEDDVKTLMSVPDHLLPQVKQFFTTE